MSTPWQDGQVRASDTEREEVATILRAAVTEGRLTLEEGDERLGKVYAAKYRDYLRPLTADLPGQGRQALWNTPEMLAGMKRRFRMHGIGAIGLAVLLVGLWMLSGAHFFWPLIPLLLIAFSVRRHARFLRYLSWAGKSGQWGQGGWGNGPWGGRGPWGRGGWGHGGWGPGRGPQD